MGQRISKLKQSIHAALGVDSHLVSSERVVLRDGASILWEGDVLIFRLVEHAVFSKCYVWDQDGEVRIVPHAPPRDTPEKAVRKELGAAEVPARGIDEGDAGTVEFILVARIEAKPGMHRLVREELEKLLAPARSEPGCTRFQLHQALDDPRIFLFYETWRSEEDFERYLETPEFRAWCVGCEDLIVGRPEITRWHAVAEA